jgi:diaminopimelate epimerase
VPRLPVTKCQGLGNDFLLLEGSSGDAPRYATIAKTLCDRHFGIGADGLIVMSPSNAGGADLEMRIFNADGSEGEMCGNGARCVARFRFERAPGSPRSLALATKAGVVRTDIVSAGASFSVRVTLGAPESVLPLSGPQVICGQPVFGVDVSIGNPHRVLFFDLDPAAVDLDAIASEIAAGNGPGDGVNVEVARLVDGAIDMRVHERGVGETLACGTGACAAAIAAIAIGKAASPVRVSMRGGDVVVEWSGPKSVVSLTGAAELVFDTEIDVAEVEAAAEAAAS